MDYLRARPVKYLELASIDLWFKRTAETGNIQPKKRNFSQSKQKISDLDAFRQFADQHQDRTQAEMAQWDEIGWTERTD